MKLVDLTCPNCGAALKVNSELNKCLCNYCGHEMMIDEEINKNIVTNGEELGYQQWQGSRAAIDQQRNQLLQQISAIKDPLKNLESTYEALKKMENKLSATSVPTKPSAIIKYGGGLVIGLFVGTFFASIMDAEGGSALLLLAVFCVCSIIITCYATTSSYDKNLKYRDNLEEAVAELKEKYTMTSEELSDKLNVIPPDYRYSFAVESFYKYINNNRAENITQAVNLYEEELHRLRLENNQEAILRENQKQTALQAQNLVATVLLKR